MVVMTSVQGLGIGEVALLPITSLSVYLNQHVLDMRVLIIIVLANDMKVTKGLCDQIVKWDTAEVECMNDLNVLTLY
jgi:hypothetical protein